MIESIYQIYREQKKMLDHSESDIGKLEETFLLELKLGISILDEAHPEYKERYEREIVMQKSFTPEQIDFICYQIGDWYLEWKHHIIVDLENGTHRLGYAKELLKTKICGE
jgi:hypothetical protein